jgi:AbrB family looped-hinge helix DNA binding protein
MLDISRVKAKGQITIPVQMRDILGIKEGDKVVFVEQNGKVFLENATKVAFREIQAAFAGEAEKSGITNEGDVNRLVKEVRHELWEERYAHND